MRRIFLCLVVTALLSSCNWFGGKKVRGNGNITTQNRTVGSFNSVEAGGAVHLRIKQGPSAVNVQTDENLMEYLEIKVDGNTLVIETRNGYNLDPSKEVNVYISSPAFEEIDVSGASKVFSESLITQDDIKLNGSGASEFDMEVKASKLSSSLSGACKLRLKGSADEFVLEASGASNVNCLDLITNEADLDLSGASDVILTVEKKLKVEASGASHVEYKGNADVNQNSSGASSVKKID